MSRVPPAEIGLAVERFEAHLAHQAPDTLATQAMAVFSQEGAKRSTARARNFQMQFVDPAHQGKLFR